MFYLLYLGVSRIKYSIFGVKCQPQPSLKKKQEKYGDRQKFGRKPENLEIWWWVGGRW
jgi:hypothetical protein